MSEEAEDGKPVSKSFTAYDVQRYRLQKLMENPDKPVVIPPRQDPKSKKTREAPEFVRNVMGSSAGAGSGEFHVYRHLRRKEFARQRMIEEDARREELDSEFQARLERNRREAEERVEKNRLKRLKKKQKMKGNKKAKKSADKEAEEESEDDDECSDGQAVKDDDKVDSNPVTVQEPGEESSSNQPEAAAD